MYPTKLTHSTPTDATQGFVGGDLATGSSRPTGCLVASGEVRKYVCKAILDSCPLSIAVRRMF